MNAMYSAALADEHRAHLRAQADAARFARRARRTARRDTGISVAVRRLGGRLAFRRPVIIGRPRPA